MNHRSNSTILISANLSIRVHIHRNGMSPAFLCFVYFSFWIVSIFSVVSFLQVSGSSSLDIGPKAKRKCKVRTCTVAYTSRVMSFSIPNRIKNIKIVLASTSFRHWTTRISKKNEEKLKVLVYEGKTYRLSVSESWYVKFSFSNTLIQCAHKNHIEFSLILINIILVNILGS